MDWDTATFVVMMLGLLAGFLWRKTRVKIYFYVWLGLIWLEVQTRAIRDSKTPKDQRTS